MLQDHEADLEEEAFIFRYNREGKPPKVVRVFSKHVRVRDNLQKLQLFSVVLIHGRVCVPSDRRKPLAITIISEAQK